MNKNKPNPQVRLQAKKMHYEQEAMVSQMRIKNNINNVKTDAIGVLTAQLSEVTEKKSPKLHRLLQRVLPKDDQRIEIEQMSGRYARRPAKPSMVKKAMGLAAMALPMILTSFKAKLIFFGVKKTRGLFLTLLKKILKSLF